MSLAIKGINNIYTCKVADSIGQMLRSPCIAVMAGHWNKDDIIKRKTLLDDDI